MNAPVKMGLLQCEGFTVLKRGVVEKDAGNGGGKRMGLDDDPSRWDEPGALLFMALYPNNRDDFPYYGNAPGREKHKDALCVEAALWTTLGPDREQHRDRMRDWHMGDPDNTEERLEANIGKFEKEGTSLGADFLYSYPKMQPYAQTKRLEEASRIFADPVPLEYSSDAPPLAPSGTDRVKRPAITVLTLGQIEKQASAEPPDFVEGTICDGGTSGWYGETNVGKSFVLLDLGLRVSLGWSWHERSVERGGVIYIAGEGARGIMQRVAAWRKHHGEEKTADAWFAVIPDMPNCRDKLAIDGLIEAIKQIASQLGGRVRLVVFDTLSRAIAGGNENGPEDMSALIASLGRVQTATGTHVAVIHHPGKDITKGARGHSSWVAALDSEFCVERPEENGPITVTTTKQRDLEYGKPVAFTLRTGIKLGHADRRGKPVTSCVVEPVNMPPGKTKRLPDDAQTGLNILRDMLPEGEGAAVRVDDWRRAVYAAFGRDGFKNTSTLRSKFNRARDTLAAAGSIEIRGDGVTVPWTAWTGQEKREGAE
jgi:hypothetical protein